MSRSIRTALLLALMTPVARAAAAQTIAITGGTVYPISGPRIDGGTVLIRDGIIVAVGRDVLVPTGATRIDATGRVVTPGFFAAASELGAALIGGAAAETREVQHDGDVNAAFNVGEGIDPAAVSIPVARLEGITTAVVTAAGSLLPGQAVLIDLDGDRVESMLVRSPVAMMADVSQESKGAGGGSRAGALQRLRQILRDALEYAERRADFRKAQMQPLAAPAADLDALLPVLRGELPLYVTANRRSDIESALRLAREFKLRLIVRGGVEAWQVAPALAAAKVPVAIEPMTDIPSFDAPGARLDNGTILHDAGVMVLITHRGEDQMRDLRQSAGNAVRNGMSWDAALRAVTLDPARAFGVADRYGSLEAGRVANVVVWSGDPLELSSGAERVLIRGRDLPMTSRQTQLRERYRTLPPRY